MTHSAVTFATIDGALMAEAPDPGRGKYKRRRGKWRLRSRLASGPPSRPRRAAPGTLGARRRRGRERRGAATAAAVASVASPTARPTAAPTLVARPALGRNTRVRLGRRLARPVRDQLIRRDRRAIGGGRGADTGRDTAVLGDDDPRARLRRAPARVEGARRLLGHRRRARRRSDTMMLIRTGGGSTARLSIPRDTMVDLPGYG